MISDHIHMLLMGLALSLSALSFLAWAWLSGHLSNPEEAKRKAYQAEMGEEDHE